MTREANRDEHQAAGEQVAEQSEGQGDRLDELLDPVHEQVDRVEHLGGERLGEVVLEVAADAPVLDGGPVDQDDDEQGHGQGQVDVAGRRGQPVVGAADAEHLEQVAGEDEHEQGQGQRDHLGAPGADGVVHLLLHRPDGQLPDQLELARHPVGGLRRRTSPMVITMAAAMTVAQMMSASKVRPNSLNWGWTPGVMSIPSIGVVRRWLPSPMAVRHRPGCHRATRRPAAAGCSRCCRRSRWC